MKSVINAIVILAAFFIYLPLNADEKELLDLAESYRQAGQYYYAVTEIKRYQHLYPEGALRPRSHLILGKTFYEGGNYQSALEAFGACRERYPFVPEAEEALYLTGQMRLRYGSTLFALREYNAYRHIYPEGRFIEPVYREICYVSVLNYDLPEARKEIAAYREKFPGGRYEVDLKIVDDMILEEINRPKKSVGVSVLGSIILPGFGHFYTGKYYEGFLSLASNALFIYLAVDGWRDGDSYRAFFFSFVELSFYQYSLYSAVSNVYQYNSQEKFLNTMKLRLSYNF